MAEETKLIIDIPGACKHFEEQTGKKLTPYRLSREINVPDTTFSHWANGKSVKSFDTLQKISDYTGFPINELIKKV